ncbi:MAG: translocation and assembly module TamA, partial [Sphingomonadales bacterium]|nr:translocation and assembly module TamA [Sphingomonadales bacterium]
MAAAAAGAMAFAGGADAAQSTHKAAPPPPPPAPIVPDDQFQKELPPLDPDLTKPLEPIDAFKGPDGKPLTAPILAPNGTLPPVTAPPDPALTEPLAPLSTFDVTTPPPAAKGANDDESKVEPVRYTLVVEGLKEVGLEGRFRSLSALEDADGKATNGAMVSARAREDELLAVRLLRSEGYYDATALSSIEQLPETPGQLRVVITTVPGARYSLGAITIQGAETVPPGLAREALPLKTGDPIVAADVEAAEANVRLRLPQQGYPFADVGLRDILLDPDTRRGDYTLPVDPGPRSTFAGFTTEGKLAFDARHVGVLARFKRGELYDSR